MVLKPTQKKTEMIQAILVKVAVNRKKVNEDHQLKTLQDKLAELEENFERKNSLLQSRLESAENELHEVKMEFKQFKDVEIDEVTKLKTQLDEAEKKNESTNDELMKKVEENVN